jgi:hypothetical protein
MDRLYKWLVGVGTAVIGNLPGYAAAGGCNGACGGCGASCLAAPALVFWLLAVFLFGKLPGRFLLAARKGMGLWIEKNC